MFAVWVCCRYSAALAQLGYLASILYITVVKILNETIKMLRSWRLPSTAPNCRGLKHWLTVGDSSDLRLYGVHTAGSVCVHHEMSQENWVSGRENVQFVSKFSPRSYGLMGKPTFLSCGCSELWIILCKHFLFANGLLGRNVCGSVRCTRFALKGEGKNWVRKGKNRVTTDYCIQKAGS